jgi:ribulose-5-phosphate 4-epimerase/fuculose-1-phosphate aldolase
MAVGQPTRSKRSISYAMLASRSSCPATGTTVRSTEKLVGMIGVPIPIPAGDQGVVDGLGHVSVRHPDLADAYLLSCNRAPALVRRADIVCYDLDGEAVSATRERPYLERFIHGEIYRARPDVVAVVHSHSPSVIPFGAVGQPLRPIFHMAGFLGEGSAHYDIRDGAGDTDMLIRNPELGRSLAAALGRCSCVLMRGHGSTTVGVSIEQVVYGRSMPRSTPGFNSRHGPSAT